MTGPRHADRPSHTEGFALDPDILEVAPGTQKESVQGWVPTLATDQELRLALEKAFDYRGDVTITPQRPDKNRGVYFRSGCRTVPRDQLCEDSSEGFQPAAEDRL